MFLLQGIPVQQGGKVTGVLRDSQGTPLPGVRMAAVSRGGTLEETAVGVSMAGLAQTDENGRFTLEDIPPGRYSIAAGRLDLQTYHPGTQSLVDATILTVTAGETISGINFTLNNSSIGRAAAGGGGTPQIVATIPVQLTVEKGGKLPVSADGKLINLRLEYSTNAISIPIYTPLVAPSFVVPGPVIGDVRVEVENLPEYYEVKSVAYGAQVLPQRVFRLTAASFSTVITRAAIPPPPQPPANPQDPQYLQAVSSYLQARANTLNALGVVSTFNNLLSLATSSTAPATTPPSTLSITIGEVVRPKAPGVRVTGQTGGQERRLVYISGRPGVVFSDGTFEFRGVPPGRHLIAAVGPSRAAVVVVVGNNDVDGVDLKPAPLLPDDVTKPKDPLPAGDLAPGKLVSLARITGVVLEETSKMPVTEGEVVIRSGNLSRNVPIDDKGRFETFTLFPGTYDMRLQIFGHSTIGPTVTVSDKDIDLEVSVRRLY
jgi:hypothetical protein